MHSGNVSETKEAGRLTFREPVESDGPAIYALIERCKPLDINSRYCYLILTAHFASTCAVAERAGEVVAFISAYIPPQTRDTLFVWQVAVDASLRGQGMAKMLLRHLLGRQSLKGIRFVEATVNPSNDASRALFTSLARECSSEIQETLLFGEELLGEGEHEQENLIRVGPIDSVRKTLIGRK